MIRRPTILVVDDDADVRAAVADALAETGYRVAEAANGRQALNVLRGDAKPDAILLDLMMPVMDGWAFRREQQKDEALAVIPVVIFTAYGVPKDAAAQLGAAGVLRKPPSLTELLAAVAAAVRH